MIGRSPTTPANTGSCVGLETPTSRPTATRDSLTTPEPNAMSQHQQHPGAPPNPNKRVKESPTVAIAATSNLELLIMALTAKVDGHAETATKNLAALRADQLTQDRKLQSLSNEFSAIEGTVTTISNDVDAVKAEVKALTAASASLSGTQQNQDAQIAQMRQQLKALANEVSKHTTDISECKVELIEAKEEKNREARNYEIMIRGIPLTGAEKQEELEGKLVKLVKAIGLTITPADVEEAHIIRTRSDNSDKPKTMVVVRFASLKTRRSFFRFYIKNSANFNTKALGEPVEERIYATDNLTKRNAEIRRVAGKLKKDGKLHSYSIFKGEVSIVVAEGQRHTRVHSLAELESAVGISGINNSISNMEL